MAEDLQISKEGMKIGPAQGDSTFKLEDMEDLSVILGSGASGTVKKMKHKPTGTLVAVKVCQRNARSRKIHSTTSLRVGRSVRRHSRNKEQALFRIAHSPQFQTPFYCVLLWCLL